MMNKYFYAVTFVAIYASSGHAFADYVISSEGYIFKKINENYFNNSYSSLKLSVQPKSQKKPAGYVALPDSIAHTGHVQKIFPPTSIGRDGSAEFDIYFPLLKGLTELPLKVYVEGVDPAEITEDTPYMLYTVKIENKKSGHALMLYQENKERNVRVFQTTDSTTVNQEINKPANYVWYGRNLDNASEVIVDAIAHITEEKDTSLLDILNLEKIADGKTSNIRVSKDPSNNDKAHIYIHTDQTGGVTLRVSPSDVPGGGKLIYWPFANNISEAARIAVYDPDTLAKDFTAPIIRKNPITVGNDTVCDVPVFDITNRNPKRIKDNGRLYLLINGNYDSSITTQGNDTLTVSGSSRFVNTSTVDLPQSNDAQYLYVAENGTISTSDKYSFFAYAGRLVNRLTGDGNTITTCEKDLQTRYNFNAAMSAQNEIPPVANKQATGELMAQYDMHTKRLQWKIIYSGLTGANQMPVAAHFHGPASPAQNADIIINIPADQLASPIEGQQMLTKEQEEGLIKGLWYFNIHTKQNPMGVLRAQLSPE